MGSTGTIVFWTRVQIPPCPPNKNIMPFHARYEEPKCYCDPDYGCKDCIYIKRDVEKILSWTCNNCMDYWCTRCEIIKMAIAASNENKTQKN